MRRPAVRRRRLFAGVLLTLATLVGVPALAQASTFTNAASIALRDPSTVNPTCTPPDCNATAGTYPSSIPVSGLTGTVSNVSLSLNNVSYAFSDDIDALLVSPTGQSLIVIAAVGPNVGASEAASNSTLTVSDSGTEPTDLTAWGSAPDFKPSNFGSYGLGLNANGSNEDYTSPAPAAPWGDPGQHGTNATLGNTFGGIAPNGTWKLYVITTSGGDGTGAIAGGWTLNLTTAAAATPTTTTLASSPNPSFTSGASSSVTLTSTTTSTSTVNAGTVDFTDGGATISGCGAQPVNGSGVATCTTTFTTEGNHSLEALYGGTASFAQSNGTLTQQVDDHTTVTGQNYCNTGAITLQNPPSTVADAGPYPSRVFVSGLSGTLNHLAITLNGVSYADSQDIDALLVGPAGQSLILVADAGPNTPSAMSNVTLTLDDNAATTLSSSATWGAPGSTVTSKPVNYGGLNETFGAPAPAGPYGNPGPAGGGTQTLGSEFNGTNPNGTWSLYLITTAAGDGTGSVSGGWCASVAAASAAATATTVTSNNNPSFTASPGNTVTFTANVSAGGTPVTAGTVEFTSNGAPIVGCTAATLNAGGQATCTTSFTQEGSDTIEALYAGTTDFGASNDSLTQTVNDHTNVTGNNFCNTGTIALENPPSTVADAAPYPSRIFVTGRPGNLQHISVTLKGVTYSESQDIDALLVGPGGQSLILVGDAGPNSGGAISNVTLTLDDNAASTLSSTAIWGAQNATVTSKPVNYGGFNETFGAPAPAGPYGNPGPSGGGTDTLGSTFNGSSPNGTWSLYLITTAAGDGTGAAAGGWCMNLTSPAPPTLSKAFGASSIPLGGSTSLTFTVTNPNTSSSLTGVGFTDTLPAGLTLATPANESGTCGGGMITAADGGTEVDLSGATLAASASCTFSVNVTGIGAGAQTNTTSVPTSNEGGSGTAATASLTVVAPPTLTKSFGPSTITLGGSSTLTFTATNPNASASLSGIAFTDTLPSGLVVSTPNLLTGGCGGGTITAIAGSGSISLTGATLAGGASCTFTVSVTPAGVGTYVNTTSAVSSTEGGNGTAASDTLTVVAAPVSITKAFGASQVALGGSTSLTFTITNVAGNGPATGVAFTDTLPAGLVVSTPNALIGSCGSGTVTATAGDTSVSLSGGTLADGDSCSFSVNITGTTAGLKNNSVTVSSTEGGTGNTANASLTVVAPPTLSKSFTPDTIALNGASTLAFTLSNPNAGTALTGLGFTDTLPTGLVITTPNALTGSCGGGTIGATAGGTAISLSGAVLAAGASCTFSVSVTGTAAGSYTNTTSQPASTEGGAGTAASAQLTVNAGPVMLSKAFGAATIPQGASTSLSFTITNPAANGTSTGIGFTDVLPAGLTVSTPNGLTGSCGGGTITAAAGSGSVSLAGSTLAGGATCTFSVNVTGITAGVDNNSVTVSSTNGGTGNTANASVTVVAPPSVSKAFGASSVPLGGSTSLSFTIDNPNATVALTGVALTDTLPAGLGIASPSGLTGSCGGGTVTPAAASGTITLTGGTIAAGGSCTFTVNVTGVAAGTQSNTTGNVTSTEGGTGGTASATLHVVAPPHIAKAFGATSVALGGTTSLTFTLTNPAANTNAENGVAFTDTFPAGLVVATPNGASTTCSGGTLTAVAGTGTVSASGFTIPVGGSCTISLNVLVTASGTFTNSVTVSSTNGGTGNTATAMINGASPPTLDTSFGASTVALGGSTTLSFTVTNPNAGIGLTGVGFTDTLPAGLTLATPAAESGSCGGGTISAPDGGTAISLTGASLGNGASCTFSVNVTGVGAGTQTNTTSAPTSNEGGSGLPATASIVVVAPPTLAASFGAPSITVGTSTTLSFTVTNPNAATTLTGLGFTDHLPSGLAISTPNGLTGSCGGGTITATAAGSTISLAGATLAGGASCTFSVSVTATAAGSQVNTTGAPTSNEGGAGTAANATLDVTKAAPSMSTVASASVKAGGQLTDTATISGGYTPGGSIVFKAYGPNDSGCTASPAFTSSAVTVSGNGQYTSPSFSVTKAGTYLWIAAYTGDSNNGATAGHCGDMGESVAVTQATPTISTQASAGVALGGQVTDTATIASGTAPGGAVAFTLYGAGDTGCTGTPVFTSTPVGVTGNGAYTSPSFKPTAVGTYQWVAAYSGDTNNAGASTHCGDTKESVVIAQVPSTTTITSSNNPSTVGDAVTFTATVTGTSPTGTVTFNDGTTALGTGTLNASGVATFTTAGLSQGTHSITAVYGGDASNAGSTSDALTQVVASQHQNPLNPKPPTVTITAPKQGAHYDVGQIVDAHYSCAEGANGTGLASCTGTVANGAAIDTHQAGKHHFTVTAVSKDGLKDTRTVVYHVRVSTKFTITHVTGHADGSVTAVVTMSGPGVANFLVTAWNSNIAHAAKLLQPAAGRFVFGRLHLVAAHAETVTVTVEPNAQGTLLVEHPMYPFVLRFWASWTPTGGSQTNYGYYGVHQSGPPKKHVIR